MLCSIKKNFDRLQTVVFILCLSAAFDTVDHTFLLDRLRVSFGLGGSVLSWITSFIYDRTQ